MDAIVSAVNNDGFFLRPGKSDHNVVILAGFATDHRIFDGLPLDVNRIFPSHVATHTLAERLFAYLQKAGAGKVTLLGWSMGAFLASDFAEKYPESVKRLVLVGARRRYDRSGLDPFGKYLRVNREQCLQEFYARCFLPTQKTAYRRFRRTLLSAYLEEMSAERLIRDLQYLNDAEIRPNRNPACPTIFVHGARDVVAPVAEVMALAAGIPGVSFHILENASHAAFLDEGFSDLFGHLLRTNGET